jgi:AhpC/TSA family
MKLIFAFILVISGLTFAHGQGNEQSPIVEKDIAYKDWSYKNLRTGEETNLRKFTQGKKLVMVVYFAPWCPNWKHDVAFVQSMYEKYKDKGFDVIAVGEYEPLDSMKNLLTVQKVTFPVVVESDVRTAKQTTTHYEYRRSVGDTRNWGSPWYIFLDVGKLEAGNVMTKKAPVVNGELMRPDAEKFIRERLGLKAESGGIAIANEIEACEPEKKSTALVIPVKP